MNDTIKTGASVIIGALTWVLLITLCGFVIRATWPAYVAVEESMAFTLPMLFTRLGIGAVALLVAAKVATMIASKPNLATLILGTLLLVIFIPIHIGMWNVFPVWYHLTFLLTLIPLSIVGGKISLKK